MHRAQHPRVAQLLHHNKSFMGWLDFRELVPEQAEFRSSRVGLPGQTTTTLKLQTQPFSHLLSSSNASLLCYHMATFKQLKITNPAVTMESLLSTLSMRLWGNITHCEQGESDQEQSLSYCHVHVRLLHPAPPQTPTLLSHFLPHPGAAFVYHLPLHSPPSLSPSVISPPLLTLLRRHNAASSSQSPQALSARRPALSVKGSLLTSH